MTLKLQLEIGMDLTPPILICGGGYAPTTANELIKNLNQVHVHLFRAIYINFVMQSDVTGRHIPIDSLQSFDLWEPINNLLTVDSYLIQSCKPSNKQFKFDTW